MMVEFVGLSTVKQKVCGNTRFLFLMGRQLSSLDLIVIPIGGLDCWTGLVDPTLLPVKAFLYVFRIDRVFHYSLKCSTIHI